MRHDTFDTAPTTAAFTVEGMTCRSCVQRVGTALNAHVDGLDHQIDLAAGKLTVSFDPGATSVEAIARVMDEAGYPVTRI